MPELADVNRSYLRAAILRTNPTFLRSAAVDARARRLTNDSKRYIVMLSSTNK